MQDFQNELGTWLLLLVISEHGNPVHLLLGHLVLSLNFCTGSCSALLFPLIVLYCFFVFLHFCCHVKEMPVFTFDLMHFLLLLFFFSVQWRSTISICKEVQNNNTSWRGRNWSLFYVYLFIYWNGCFVFILLCFYHTNSLINLLSWLRWCGLMELRVLSPKQGIVWCFTTETKWT